MAIGISVDEVQPGPRPPTCATCATPSRCSTSAGGATTASRYLAEHGLGDTPRRRASDARSTTTRSGPSSRPTSPAEWADAVAFDAAIRHGSARANADGHPLRGQFFLHRQRVPLDQVVLRPRRTAARRRTCPAAGRGPARTPPNRDPTRPTCGRWREPRGHPPHRPATDAGHAGPGSDRCAPATAASTWPSSWCSAAGSPGTPKPTRTPRRSSPTAGPASPTSATSAPSTGPRSNRSTSSPPDSPARTSPTPANATASPASTPASGRRRRRRRSRASTAARVRGKRRRPPAPRASTSSTPTWPQIGYDTRWICLRASDVGAAHRRDRLFLLAARPTTASAAAARRCRRRAPVTAKAPATSTACPTSSSPAAAPATSAAHPDRGGRTASQPVPVGRGGGAAQPGDAGTPRLLPTPTVADSRVVGQRHRRAGGPPSGMPAATLTDAARLLPTPRASDGAKGCPGQRGSNGDLTLPSAAVSAHTSAHPARLRPARGRAGTATGGADLAPRPSPALTANRPARRPGPVGRATPTRWPAGSSCSAGRSRPDPAGRHGKPVLAPPFVEWLMGLDARLGHRPGPAAPHPRAAGARQRRRAAAGRRRAAAAAVPAPVGGAAHDRPPPVRPGRGRWPGSRTGGSGRSTLYLGDARDVLAAMPDASVDCVVTSPPFWRCATTAPAPGPAATRLPAPRPAAAPRGRRPRARPAGRCGPTRSTAWSRPSTHYVDRLVAVFDQARRVLTPTGTLLAEPRRPLRRRPPARLRHGRRHARAGALPPMRNGSLLPAKNLHRRAVAGRLRAAAPTGWWLRNAIVWAKTNPMPESVTDRLSTTYELVFLLTRSAEVLLRPRPDPAAAQTPGRRRRQPGLRRRPQGRHRRGRRRPPAAAAAPTATNRRQARQYTPAARGAARTAATSPSPGTRTPPRTAGAATPATCGRCRHPPVPRRAHRPVPDRHPAAGDRRRLPTRRGVLDPFSGAGTTGLAALQLGRTYIGIDISPTFHDVALDRLAPHLPDADRDRGWWLMGLRTVPVTFAQARDFVAAWHRHHRPPGGHKFTIGVADDADVLVGVAMVGRPVARLLDDGHTLEVTRCAPTAPATPELAVRRGVAGRQSAGLPAAGHLHPGRRERREPARRRLARRRAPAHPAPRLVDGPAGPAPTTAPTASPGGAGTPRLTNPPPRRHQRGGRRRRTTTWHAAAPRPPTLTPSRHASAPGQLGAHHNQGVAPCPPPPTSATSHADAAASDRPDRRRRSW